MQRSVVLAMLALGLALWPPPPCGAQAPPITPITACTTIAAPGLYQLANDVIFSSTSGVCITITAQNALLDLNNHIVSGPGGNNNAIGILFKGATLYSTLMNGTISGFGIGIKSAALWIFYDNLNVRFNSQIGFLVQSQYNRFMNSTVSLNGQYGIKMNAAYGSVIDGTTISSNGIYGIFAARGGDYRITGSLFQNNTTAGIYMGCAAQGSAIPCPPSSINGSVLATTAIGNSVSGSVYGIAADQTVTATRMIGNSASGNSFFDLWDAFADCGASIFTPVSWYADTFSTASTAFSPTCIQ